MVEDLILSLLLHKEEVVIVTCEGKRRENNI